VSFTFLRRNGWQAVASEAEIVVAFLALAAGELSEEEMAGWFRRHLVPA
jgi:death-on-curing protein